MSVYDVVFTSKAAKQLASLERSAALRISGAIELLRTHPYPPKASKLTGRQGYRVRVGDYRILYDVVEQQLIIRVFQLGHRRDVYR